MWPRAAFGHVGRAGARAATAGRVGAGRRTATTAASPPAYVDGVRVEKRRVVGAWLLGTGSMVFGTVVLGGLTRLTESGLSIVDWRPITGTVPPLTAADWEAEFDKYRKSPEYKLCVPAQPLYTLIDDVVVVVVHSHAHGEGEKERETHTQSPSVPLPLSLSPSHGLALTLFGRARHNAGMSLAEFKRIFWMEWAHRQVGRTIGLAYLLPMGYFIGRGYVSRSMALRLVGIGGLIGTQVRLVASPLRHSHIHTQRLSLSLSLSVTGIDGEMGGWVHAAGPDWVADGQERPGRAHCGGARRAAREPLSPHGAPRHRLCHLPRHPLEQPHPSLRPTLRPGT
jgi:hypothetical protein